MFALLAIQAHSHSMTLMDASHAQLDMCAMAQPMTIDQPSVTLTMERFAPRDTTARRELQSQPNVHQEPTTTNLEPRASPNVVSVKRTHTRTDGARLDASHAANSQVPLRDQPSVTAVESTEPTPLRIPHAVARVDLTTWTRTHSVWVTPVTILTASQLCLTIVPLLEPMVVPSLVSQTVLAWLTTSVSHPVMESQESDP